MAEQKSTTYGAKDIPVINPDIAMEVIQQAYELRQPLILWGPPGAGKTSGVRSAADALRARYGEPFLLKEVYLSRMTPADVGGLPALDSETKKTTFYLPDNLTDLKSSERGIIFFDELTTADPQTRAAVLNLILEGRLGEFTLPKGWFCVAAANPKEFGGIYGDLGAAMNNRLMHYDVRPEFNQWVEAWAPANNVSPAVMAFLRNGNDSHFMASAEEFRNNPKSFPTPRNWVRVGEIVERVANPKTRDIMIDATIGLTASGFFKAWYRECEGMRPMVEYLEASEDAAAIHKILPRKIAGLYLIACSARAYVTNENPKRSEQALALLNAIYFAKESKEKGDSFNNAPTREIGVLGWEMAGTKALAIKYPASKSQHFSRYNNHRVTDLKVLN